MIESKIESQNIERVRIDYSENEIEIMVNSVDEYTYPSKRDTITVYVTTKHDVISSFEMTKGSSIALNLKIRNIVIASDDTILINI